jgi:hypothetical protein
MNTTTCKQAVYDMLKEARSGTIMLDGVSHEVPGGWVPGQLINEIGGTNGLRRLRELRAEGYVIAMRRKGRMFEYRLNKVKPVK